jgi:hypothetical protein
MHVFYSSYKDVFEEILHIPMTQSFGHLQIKFLSTINKYLFTDTGSRVSTFLVLTLFHEIRSNNETDGRFVGILLVSTNSAEPEYCNESSRKK